DVEDAHGPGHRARSQPVLACGGGIARGRRDGCLRGLGGLWGSGGEEGGGFCGCGWGAGAHGDCLGVVHGIHSPPRARSRPRGDLHILVGKTLVVRVGSFAHIVKATGSGPPAGPRGRGACASPAGGAPRHRAPRGPRAPSRSPSPASGRRSTWEPRSCWESSTPSFITPRRSPGG